ncbi:c-type cytochrome [Sulfurimonas marina]|uniref:C-type cytochrome n=1 Tax=Sulfurimonas marina TaxID=2590551 RepID=A0A7M1AX78_9BACT|nr:c-type cytochrome [Sulfurimonas marina]QOP42059.1 c-type cytochrome [Sulfurimonas marina]
MKELKILAVVVFFTLVTYYLVEPFAHSQMHKHIESEGFAYEDLADVNLTDANVTNGQELVMGAGACLGCHSMEVAGMPAPMDPVTAAQSYGVNPPDLSNAGAVYDAKFLADLIKNPAHALMVEHKFDAEKGQMHPMVPFYGAGGDLDKEVADMVAYLQSVAVKKEELTSEQAYELACGRCHANHYAEWTQLGNKPAFKKEQEELKYKSDVLDYQDSLKAYMGKLPPDLSIYIRSRGAHYIETFVENPQNYLKGTAMPRVGVNEHAMEKVIEYLEDSGDAKRAEREEVGKNVMIYIIIFAIFAILWKKAIWRDLH